MLRAATSSETLERAQELLRARTAAKGEGRSAPQAAKASEPASSAEPRDERVAGAAGEASPDVRVVDVVPGAEPRLALPTPPPVADVVARRAKARGHGDDFGRPLLRSEALRAGVLLFATRHLGALVSKSHPALAGALGELTGFLASTAPLVS